MVVPTEQPQATDNELYMQLRNTFLENLNSNGNYDDYEEADIEKIRNDDNYCKRFLRHKKGKLLEALEMVDESLRWRKSFKVKDVNMGSIPMEFFQMKAVFPFNQDKAGNPIIVLLVRFHKKNSEFQKELLRFVIYWVELMEAQTNGGKMTVVMSCAGAGISNLDLDLIKFLITLYHAYYPDSLAHILIFEFPWILNPAWKIIKAWLPEDFVDKIKFVNKTSLQDYVTQDCLPLEMGGTDATEYEPPSLEEWQNAKKEAEPKKVAIENGITSPSQVIITDDYSIIGGIMKISPATVLLFNPHSENYTNDVVIKLTSVAQKTISYKVKTNNIESYRVKPSLGVIEPGSSVDITVVLLSGFQPLSSDKFLIMAMEISNSNLSTPSLNNLWKASPSDAIADHKLKCVVQKTEKLAPPQKSDLEQSLNSINLILSNLEKKVQALDAKQASLQFIQTFSLSLTVFLVFIFLGHLFLRSDSFWSSIFEK